VIRTVVTEGQNNVVGFVESGFGETQQRAERMAGQAKNSGRRKNGQPGFVSVISDHTFLILKHLC